MENNEMKKNKNTAIFGVLVLTAMLLAGMFGAGRAEAGTGWGSGSGVMPYIVGSFPYHVQSSWSVTMDANTSYEATAEDAVVDSSGDIWIVSKDNLAQGVLTEFDANGNELGVWTPAYCPPGDNVLQEPWACTYISEDPSDPYNSTSPVGVAAYGAGSSEVIYVADAYNNQVWEIGPSGNYLNRWGSLGSAAGLFNSPEGVAVDPSSGDVYVADTGNNRIQEFNSSWVYLGQWGVWNAGGTMESFNHPEGVAVGPDGDVFVADTNNNRIEEFSPAGAAYLGQWGFSSPSSPSSVTFGSYGTGSAVWSGPAPSALAVDASGNVYAGNSGNYVKFNPSTGLWVSGTIGSDTEYWDRNGDHSTDVGGPAWDNLDGGTIAAVDSSGNLYGWVSGGIKKLSGNATGYAMLKGTFEYNGQPLPGAYVYFQPGGQIAPFGQYFQMAKFIGGPTDSNGNFSFYIPPGSYNVMVLKRNSVWNATIYGPPAPGDYLWHSGAATGSILAAAGQTVDLGTVDAAIWSNNNATSISGTVTANGKPMIGWSVRASTGPLQPLYYYGQSIPFPNQNSALITSVAKTGSNGSYTLNLPDQAASYYITACSSARGCMWWGYEGGYGAGPGGAAQATSVSAGQQETGVNINIP